MSFQKSITLFLLIILAAAAAFAQDRATGGIKGKAKVVSGSPAGISVVVRQGEREAARTETDSKGAFILSGLAPGIYSIVLSKAGFSTGTLSNVEVKAGKVRELSDKLVLTIDEGSLAFLRGSVFDPIGRSVPGARVELARLEADGTAKKLDGRLTNESGQFVFRLTPDAAKYRVTVKMDGAETVSKDVEIDGAAVYRIALSLKPVTK
ncbi:MAG TPA: carboxypeptidase-like regulatory domain-containing protein [Pyrinomonadaceae bacterium]|jgi:hypothetical protein